MDKPTDQTELRILLLEDMPTDAELVEIALREAGLSFTAKRVDTRETFIRALEEFKPDIVLADYKLPAFDGGSALKIVQQQYPTIPVVMVTGVVGDEIAVELLRMGAKDYILKDRLARLGSAVQRALSEERGFRARKAAEESLRQSEADLRALVEHSPIAMLVDVGVEADEKIVMMNQEFTHLFGYTMEDVPDVRHWWTLAYPDEKYREEIRIEWTRRVKEAIQSHGSIEPMETTVTCKKRLSRYVRVSLASIGSRNIITFEDLTERKQTEEQIQKLTRLYATLSQTNHIIVRTTNRAELFSSICENAVTHGKFVLAWVGLVDEATRMVKPVCHYGVEESYLANIVVSSDDVPAGRGPVGTSIRENRVFCVNDYASDERTLPWREAALKCGFRGAAGVPLRFKGKAIGALTLYADEPDFFDTEQLNLLEEMAVDISFALDNFAREAERKNAEDKLAENERHFRAVTESANDAIITGAGAGAGAGAGNIVGWNAAAERLFGYSEAEIIGQPLTLLMPERFRNPHREGLSRVVAGGTPHVIGKTVELAGLRKDGSEFPLEFSLAQWQAAEGQFFTAIIRDITQRKLAESQLNEQIEELRRWHEATLGREMRTLELKHEVNELLGQAGQPPRYPSAEQVE